MRSIEREGDSEDLIDPKLYFSAFRRTVEKEIAYPEFDDRNDRKKNVNWCKDIADQNSVQFNKTIVAKQFWPMLNGMSNGINDIDHDSLETSIKNMVALIEKINTKFNI